MAHLLYQAYGLEEIYQETLFSILSLYQTEPSQVSTPICIYTDNKEYFLQAIKGLDHHIRIEQRSMDQFKSWRGEINFVHRVKLEVIKDYFATVGDHLFYLDSDTIWTKPVGDLLRLVDKSENKAWMHLCEGKLSGGANPIMKKMANFLERENFNIGAEPLKISSDSYMWNAGAIGLSRNHSALIDEMLDLTDEMFKKYSKHVIEQFVVSYSLQTRFQLIPTDEFIYHYWFFKSFRTHIQNYFKKNGMGFESLLKIPIPLAWQLEKEIEKKPLIL
jgi:hypothetical protein